MAKNTLLVHIGYHKTATTWLQRALFQTEFGYHPIMSHEDVFETIVSPHGLLFDSRAAGSVLDERRKVLSDGSINVVSSELLSGNPHYGGRESDVIAERIKLIAGDARILITIREQRRLLASLYMQYLLRGGSLSPQRFFDEASVLGYSHFSSLTFEYHRLIQRYQKLFGKSRVLVLTQEQLEKNPAGYMEQLAAFSENSFFETAPRPTNARIGASHPESFFRLFRLVNFFRSGPTGRDSLVGDWPWGQKMYNAAGKLATSAPFSRCSKSSKPISTFVKRQFADRFVQSNAELRQLIPDQQEWLKTYQ
jgi:hypothetical protein